MGGTTSSTSSERQGRRIDPSADPSYFHQIVTGPQGTLNENKALSNVDAALSEVKVCKAEANSFQRQLQREYFSHWSEKCDVAEFHDFSIHQIDKLIKQINDKFKETGQDVSKKLRAIHWAEQWSQRVFEFSFGDDLESGVVYFGMIALAKDGRNFIDGATCLYKLDFNVAQEKVVTTHTDHFLGIPIGSHTSTEYRNRHLGFITAHALKNFARTKAIEEFADRGLLSSVKYVSRLELTEK